MTSRSLISVIHVIMHGFLPQKTTIWKLANWFRIETNDYWIDPRLIHIGYWIHVLVIFTCGASTRFRVTAFHYGSSRSHPWDTPHSLVPLYTSDQPDAETSTGQHTTLRRDELPCSLRDSNSQSQQASGNWDRHVLVIPWGNMADKT